MKQLYATLKDYTRIDGSVNGNPNYTVTLEMGDGSYETLRSSSDSSWCYAIGDNWIDKPIMYTVTRSGRIDYMKRLELQDVLADKILNEEATA